jgi:DNA/RNA-binding domain of Phe-tRNA-synthetase-like protein
MNEIKINASLKNKWDLIVIGSIECNVKVEASGKEITDELHRVINNIKKNMKITDISTLPPIREGRKAYKKLGKDPARYRLSSEALLRRILKDKGISPVNNIVDINNLISLKSYHPICAFDTDKLQPPIHFTIGKKEDEYVGIGRGKLNIENMPVFQDQRGKFGSPTSDSERVKIKPATSQISMNIVSFSGEDMVEDYLDLLEQYLKKFARASNVKKDIIT